MSYRFEIGDEVIVTSIGGSPKGTVSAFVSSDLVQVSFPMGPGLGYQARTSDLMPVAKLKVGDRFTEAHGCEYKVMNIGADPASGRPSYLIEGVNFRIPFWLSIKLTDSTYVRDPGSVSSVVTNGCTHDYDSYQGLSECFDYCKHCDEKHPYGSKTGKGAA